MARLGRRLYRRADQFCVQVVADEGQKQVYVVEFKEGGRYSKNWRRSSCMPQRCLCHFRWTPDFIHKYEHD